MALNGELWGRWNNALNGVLNVNPCWRFAYVERPITHIAQGRYQFGTHILYERSHNKISGDSTDSVIKRLTLS